jgi:hypothetical protein
MLLVYSISRLNKIQGYIYFFNFINELNIIFVLYQIGKRYKQLLSLYNRKKEYSCLLNLPFKNPHFSIE